MKNVNGNSNLSKYKEQRAGMPNKAKINNIGSLRAHNKHTIREEAERLVGLNGEMTTRMKRVELHQFAQETCGVRLSRKVLQHFIPAVKH